MAILVVHADRAEYDRTVQCDRCGLTCFTCEAVPIAPGRSLCPECFARRRDDPLCVMREPLETEQSSGPFSLV